MLIDNVLELNIALNKYSSFINIEFLKYKGLLESTALKYEHNNKEAFPKIITDFGIEQSKFLEESHKSKMILYEEVLKSAFKIKGIIKSRLVEIIKDK